MATKRVAVVTGSNKGIGFATVRALCSHFDGDVFLTSRNEEKGLVAVKEIEKEELKVFYHQLDITDTNSVICLKDFMMKNYGGIDVLINNAGVAFKIEDPTPFATQAKVTIDTNFFGTMQILKILLPYIKCNGRIVNVSSFVTGTFIKKCSPEIQQELRSDTITEDKLVDRMNEFVSCAQNGTLDEKGWPINAYAVSKIGITVLSRIYARLLREQGKMDILINSCCPGWVKTDMTGSKAQKTPEQGAETLVYLALLPCGSMEPHGQYVSDKTVKPW